MAMDGLVYVNFSEAAREGDLSALKRCSRKDTNKRDIDGVTPVQWAASYGNLEALRILVGKGGNPDKPNNEGFTALHLAASTGQLHCLVFLTNFGGNIYSMSDTGTTPIQEASSKGRLECVRHLETFITHQVEQDRNKVEKMQEKAKRDAERRIKEKGKLLKKLDKDYEKKSAKHRKLGGNTYLLNNKQNTHMDFDQTDNNDHSKLTYSQLTGLPYDEEEGQDDDTSTSSSFRRIEEEFLTRTSQTSDDVLLERGILRSNDKRSDTTEHSNITLSTRSLHGSKSLATSLQSIPKSNGLIQNGYGLRGHLGPTITLKNGKIINVSEIGDINYTNAQTFGKGVQSANSIQNGNVVLQNKRNGKPNKTTDVQMGPLFTFLAALQLDENRDIFINEKIDLRACLLCDEDDLREIGLPLGPRKKIVDAIKQRNKILENKILELKDSHV